MPQVTINGDEIEIGDNERLNGIQAAQRAGIEIPHYCWHPGLSVVASCRMCLVETGQRNAETGDVSMVPKLVPACQTPAKDGSVFVTDSDRVKRARAMVEEDLLINHPIDCPICDKAGECSLQDYHFEHGQKERRADIRPFSSRRRSLGETVTLFVDRCVMCSRCVRFTREVSGTSELMVVGRGSHEEIDVFPGYPLANKLSGNVVDLCPVGALSDKEFLYRQRVWFMKSHNGVCTGCATGCSIHIDENQDRIYRLRPRENPHINGWWMCDEGRYGYHHVHDERRTGELSRRNGDGHSTLEWSTLPDALTADLEQARPLAVALSPHLTIEEAFLVAQFVRRVDPEAVVALGPVPVVGEDESYPGGFTIRSEKCPNRRGVEEIVAHFMARACGWDDLLEILDAGQVNGVWVTGGYPGAWVDEAVAKRFEKLNCLVVQDLFESPLWPRANYRVPGVAFPEREGSYVNHADHIQSTAWAVRPPSGTHSEGRLAWRLLGREGMYQAPRVLRELATTIAYFSAAGDGVPAEGLDLKLNLLAATD